MRGNPRAQTQIKGMAKGYWADAHEGSGIHLGEPYYHLSMFLCNMKLKITITLRLHEEFDLGLKPSNELMKEIIIFKLKEFVQHVGNNEVNLRKVPSEQDLSDTADVMIDWVMDKRKKRPLYSDGSMYAVDQKIVIK